MIKNVLLVVFIFLAVIADIARAQEGAGEQNFRICGIMSGFVPGKTIYLGVYANRRQFKTRQCFRKLRYLAEEVIADTLGFCFDNIPAGEYLIAGYQDTNRDQKINIGWRGPIEPYCVHEWQKGMLPPGFNRSKFKVNTSIDTLHLRFHVPADIGVKN